MSSEEHKDKLGKIDKLAISKLAEKMGISMDFFPNLLKEDDWSFIIKLHALIECSCTELLLHHFKKPDLSKVISRLELSNTTTGKLALLSSLKLLQDIDKKYIISLSELRNSLVHNVRNCNFELKEMVDGFNEQQLKSFAIAFSPQATAAREPNEAAKYFEIEQTDSYQAFLKNAEIPNIIKRAKDDPKEFIWIGASWLLGSIYDGHYLSDYINYEKAKEINPIFDEFDFEDEDNNSFTKMYKDDL
jgi:hypothetical protein